MNIDIIIIGCIAVLSGLYALFNIFGLVGLSCGIAVMLTYAILLRLKPKKSQDILQRPLPHMESTESTA